jgi:ATP-dependent RNA helicase DHX8/PRP22
MSSPERWELTQLIHSGAIAASERPDVDEETGELAVFEDQENELEIELNDEEPAFLRGQTAQTTDLSPIKVVKNPDGSLQRAALTQSALAKERRELREQQRMQQLDSVPKDLGRAWEDPMAQAGDRHLAQELRGIGMSQVHWCYTVVTLFLHCRCTVLTPFLHYCHRWSRCRSGSWRR